MKKLLYIFAAISLVFVSCNRAEPEGVLKNAGEGDIKVPITLNVRIPMDGPATKAMAEKPEIQNMVVAVFGGSGYFNEWIPVQPELLGKAIENYNDAGDYAVYQLKFNLSLSDSRLRLHFIANCPDALISNPPITATSSQDLEDVVMSKVRSQIGETNNDGYWAKILLPYGVQIKMEEEPNTHEMKPIKIGGEYVPTDETKYQFERYNATGGIPMVRNFARIYLANLATDWTIDSFCLAYAPAEGPIAPILPSPITTDEWGNRVVVQYASETDETGTVYPVQRSTAAEAPYTTRELTDADGNDLIGDALTGSTIYTESFFVNYQNFPMTTAAGEQYRKISDEPYNYAGYSPANLAIGTYPDDDSGMTAWSAATPLYIYERAKPSAGQKSTRIIIKAHKSTADATTALYYPLDLVDTDGAPLAFLRNFTYTISLTGIAEGTGHTTIADAADATSANVASDPRTADLSEISDGKSLISVSYIDATYIKQGQYDLMFHYEQPLETENNDAVSLEVGYGTGYDFVANSIAGNGSAFSGTPAIEKDGGNVVQYVRIGNEYVLYDASNPAHSGLQKWGKIVYTTATADRNGGSAVNADGYYTKGFSQTIRVYGADNSMYRDVLINLTPLKTMTVQCLDKYIEEGKNMSETVRVYIPNDLTRSMFPLTFKIEAAAQSLNPASGANLPVSAGASIVSGSTAVSYCFLKTLTRDQYNALPASADGTKYFDCPFVTIIDKSATTVYVANDYFNTASDKFYNFSQRQFTATAPGELGIGEEIEYHFYMDYAHRSGNVVWNSIDGSDSHIDYSSDRVIPHTVLITLSGISPKVESVDEGVVTYVDSPYLSRVSGNVYRLTVAENGGAPEWTDFTLHLAAGSEDDYSITLSTSGNTPNPVIYADYTVSGEISKSKIQNARFTNTSGATISSVKTDAGLPVQFRFTYGGDLAPVVFKLEGITTTDTRVSGPDASGYYTFTPSDSSSKDIVIDFTTAADVECRLYDFDVNNEAYAQPNPDSFSLLRRNRRWLTNSYTINLTSYTNANASNFTTQPQNVIFTNTERGGMGQNYYKAMGTRTWNLLSTYNNGSFTVTAPSSLTDSRITGIEMTYYGSDYDNRTVTVTGDVSTMPQSSIGMTSWTSSSTGDGNGDTTVTVTMECSSATYGNNGNGRNRLTGVTVHYGYWVED